MFRITTFIAVFLLLSGCKKDPVIITTDLNTVVTFGKSEKLDKDLNEVSGLAIDKNGLFWMHNDSGNDPVLFVVNEKGNIEKTIAIPSVNNNDWEDLAKDENDNLYIGDFGNNDNDRRNLAIYKVNAFSSIENTTTTPTIIEFEFEDQQKFPPLDHAKHFDIEAFIATAQQIYVFTKDRSDPFEGVTKLYGFPNSAGSHQAELLGIFSTASTKTTGAITGATISPSGQKLVLLSEEKLFLFQSFTAPDFFEGTVEIVDIPVERKFEGIDFLDECTLYLVNEKKYGADSQLLEVTICE